MSAFPAAAPAPLSRPSLGPDPSPRPGGRRDAALTNPPGTTRRRTPRPWLAVQAGGRRGSELRVGERPPAGDPEKRKRREKKEEKKKKKKVLCSTVPLGMLSATGASACGFRSPRFASGRRGRPGLGAASRQTRPGLGIGRGAQRGPRWGWGPYCRAAWSLSKLHTREPRFPGLPHGAGHGPRGSRAVHRG